jgi:hypothetical protein
VKIKNLDKLITPVKKKVKKPTREEAEARYVSALFNEFTITGSPLEFTAFTEFDERLNNATPRKRKRMFAPLIRSTMPTFNLSDTPVCLFVRFFVRPPDHVDVADELLEAETVPATECAELCEYFLSLLDFFRDVVIHSYKQIVKVEMDKFYSNRPRTVFQIMKFEHYVTYKDVRPIHTQSKSFRTSWPVSLQAKVLQSLRPWNGFTKSYDRKVFKSARTSSPSWSNPVSSTLPDAVTKVGKKPKDSKA